MKKWEEIYEDLKHQIISGKMPPGSPFPTNFELQKRYNAQTVTIQQAVNELIRNGFVLSQGRGRGAQRTVRKPPIRSPRTGGFSGEHGKKARKNVLELRKILSKKEMPEVCKEDIPLPSLYYHNEQFIDGVQVGVSRSIIPGNVPIDPLYHLLCKAGASLYGSLEFLGHKPVSCEESLIADLPTTAERNELHVPQGWTMPIIRMLRKTYDDKGNLVELCYLLYRADCYEFSYKFDF
jgi:GntR family transcriptional regulator